MLLSSSCMLERCFFLAGLNRPSPFIPFLYYGMFTNIHVNVLVPSANVGYIHVPKMERRGVRRSPGRKVLDTFFGWSMVELRLIHKHEVVFMHMFRQSYILSSFHDWTHVMYFRVICACILTWFCQFNILSWSNLGCQVELFAEPLDGSLFHDHSSITPLGFANSAVASLRLWTDPGIEEISTIKTRRTSHTERFLTECNLAMPILF